MSGTIPYCPKTRFATKADADFYIKKIQAHPNKSGKVPVRAYQCPRCTSWHLTSQIDYVKQAEELNKRIEELVAENAKLKAKIAEMQTQSSNDIRKEIRVDQRVKSAREQLEKAKKALIASRKNNAELVGRMLQLEKQLQLEKEKQARTEIPKT